MPADYGVEEMLADLEVLKDCIYQVFRKVPVLLPKLTFSGTGSLAQLVSCEFHGDRITTGTPDRVRGW